MRATCAGAALPHLRIVDDETSVILAFLTGTAASRLA
jgi:hypothetical protein